MLQHYLNCTHLGPLRQNKLHQQHLGLQAICDFEQAPNFAELGTLSYTMKIFIRIIYNFVRDDGNTK